MPYRLFFFGVFYSLALVACGNETSPLVAEESSDSGDISSMVQSSQAISSSSNSSSNTLSSSSSSQSSSSQEPSSSAIVVECIDLEANEICDGRDGQKYDTISIGDQVWFAENARYCGRLYGENCSHSKWNAQKWDSLGGIYNPGGGRACPSGWRVPSVDDWYALRDFIVQDTAGKNIDISISNYIKNSLSSVEVRDGTDLYGFNAKNSGCWDPYFEQSCSYDWQTSTRQSWYRNISMYDLNVAHNNNDQIMAVRCIKKSSK